MRQRNGQGPFYIRYAGCTSEDTPYGRHHADIQPATGPSRFTNFYRCLQQVLLGRQFNIFLVPSLECDSTLGNNQQRYEVDGREQALIHFLGRACILNSQPGGHYRGYVPNDNDIRSIEQAGDLNNTFNYFFHDQGPQTIPLNSSDPRFQKYQQLQTIYREGYM